MYCGLCRSRARRGGGRPPPALAAERAQVCAQRARGPGHCPLGTRRKPRWTAKCRFYKRVDYRRRNATLTSPSLPSHNRSKPSVRTTDSVLQRQSGLERDLGRLTASPEPWPVTSARSRLTA
eukprot:420054-Prymnesium_polylepis.1